MSRPYLYMITGNRLFLNRLSIQQRLTLLICTLLLSAIVIYGFANYYSLKKTILIIGKERLVSLTNQISSILGQNAVPVMKRVNAIAARDTTIQCLATQGKEFSKQTLDALNRLHRDSTWVSVELLDKDLKTILRTKKSARKVKVDLNQVLIYSKVEPGITRIGKIYNIGGEMYYPVIAAVSKGQEVIGYIICWISIKADPKSIAQFSHLVGTGAGFYLADADGSLWTDMTKPVSAPPHKFDQYGKVVEYKDQQGERILACAQPVPNTDWLTVIQFSEQNVLSGLGGFVKWIIVIGAVLTAIGIFAASVMSRGITRPLKKLTIAASEISKVDYSAPVNIVAERNDEVGELANAFSIMATKVYQMYQDLELKVAERTRQLEIANKELESFSYSVSHDLRTPLRAISGYSVMLQEDYNDKLDAEGKRIMGNIIANSKMMGQLIDDLLSFSRLGKKALIRTTVDMQVLATNVVNELLQNEDKDYHISITSLPQAEADQGMIKQALMNLVSNAIKYTSKKDRPEIEIGAIDKETRTVYYVKDNGVGFDMAYAYKLFGVFQRLHSQEEFGGTGVGLALVKRIIDKHNGEIWAEGEENVGAAFYFSLPKTLHNDD